MAIRYKYKAVNPLVKVVRDYAAKNAAVGGWDIINEAYGDAE